MTDAYSTDAPASNQVKKHSRRKSTTPEFIAKANKVHSSKYRYSKTTYTNNRGQVVITCLAHGDFVQVAKDHLVGKGCRECAKKAVAIKNGIDRAEFIRRARAKHGYTYCYKKAEYKNSTSKVVIGCDKHGDFLQIPADHLMGHGCKKCSFELAGLRRRKPKKKPQKKVRVVETQEQKTARFIRRAKELHGSKYDYSHARYNRSIDKVTIICPEHGLFEQQANSHLQGKGCYKCGRLLGGYRRSHFQELCDKNNDSLGVLYVIRLFKGTESFVKVGRTSLSVKDRFKGNCIPYEYEVLYEIKRNGSYVFDLERRLHSLLKECRHQPSIAFDGQTECFTTIKPVEPLLKKLATTEQLQLIA